MDFDKKNTIVKKHEVLLKYFDFKMPIKTAELWNGCK